MPKKETHMATGTISLDQPNPALGDTVTFTCTTEGLRGNQDARVEVQAFQDVDGDGQMDDIVYGEAWGIGVSFLLGSGSSPWLTRGGPAHCVAKLYYWDNHPAQHQVVLDTIEFDAAG